MLNERETRVAHQSIDASDILTCHQIGLDGQSHYAHKDVIAEVAVPSPNPSQLWNQHGTISYQLSRIETSLHDKASRM
jgi:hypothetical protein